jgi:3-oxoadipyl-CoA thiolase
MREHEAVIIDGLRTPFGRYGGVLTAIRPDDMAAHVIKALLSRTPVPAESIEDVFFGCANQAGEDNRDVARMALLLAGLPVAVPGCTFNRLCASGMQAVISATHAIWSGEGECFVAGGVESMSRAPLVLGKPETPFPRGERVMYDSTTGWRFINPKLAAQYPPYSMGETAENVVERFGIAREDQDAYALSSHEKALAARREGRFADEVIPVSIPVPKVGMQDVNVDEGPRPDTSLEKLSRLPPVFRKGGTVTAGNSSSLNDGAAALLVTTPELARAAGHRPLARVLATAVAGVDPSFMGLGPIPATAKALKRAGLTLDQMDVIELNEAFAGQVLACVREMKIPLDRLNPNGGAISMGHPLGASGARLVLTLVHELVRRAGRYGLATLCVGVGQGAAVVVERVAG